MIPERLDQIRTIYRVSRLAAPEAAVTKALAELIELADHEVNAVQFQAQMAQQMLSGMQAQAGISPYGPGQVGPGHTPWQQGFGGAVGLPQEGQSLLPDTVFERFKKALGL